MSTPSPRTCWTGPFELRKLHHAFGSPLRSSCRPHAIQKRADVGSSAELKQASLVNCRLSLQNSLSPSAASWCRHPCTFIPCSRLCINSLLKAQAQATLVQTTAACECRGMPLTLTHWLHRTVLCSMRYPLLATLSPSGGHALPCRMLVSILAGRPYASLTPRPLDDGGLDSGWASQRPTAPEPDTIRIIMAGIPSLC